MIADRRLTDNFRLYEFLESQTASRNPDIFAEQFNPPAEIMENLTYLVGRCVQPIRTLLAMPLGISSGYRCPALNKAVGGSPTSQHQKAEAADLKMSGRLLYSDAEAVVRIRGIIHNMVLQKTGGYLRSDINANFYLFATYVLYLDFLDVDQLIHEYGTDGSPAWVHVSASRGQDRRQILIKRSGETYIELSPHEALMLGC